MTDYSGLLKRAEKASSEMRAQNISGWGNTVDELASAIEALQAKLATVKPRPIAALPKMHKLAVYERAILISPDFTGEAVRYVEEQRWAWCHSRQWCEGVTHFIPLSAFESPKP